MSVGAVSVHECRVGRIFARRAFRLRFGAALILAGLTLSACERKSPSLAASKKEVVVYCSVDAEFAEPILAAYEKKSGTRVYHVFDTEAGKTTGLVNKLVAERQRPRADVWWSSEIFGTIQLARQGILAPYKPSGTENIPTRYRDASGFWTAVGLRGRVIAYDPKRTKKDDLPRRWADLADPKYKGRFCMADPRFGTTRGHMATLLSLWGEPAMAEFYRRLHANGVRLTDGNSQSVLLVSRGTVEMAATDTDDAVAAKLHGESVEAIYPDLNSPDGKSRRAGTRPGTLWIPCTVALAKGGPHAETAHKLIDFLVSAEVEEALAKSDSRNVPVRPALRSKLGMSAPGEAVVDYAAAGALLEESDRLVNDVLLK